MIKTSEWRICLLTLPLTQCSALSKRDVQELLRLELPFTPIDKITLMKREVDMADLPPTSADQEQPVIGCHGNQGVEEGRAVLNLIMVEGSGEQMVATQK